MEALSGPVKGKKDTETIQAVEVAPEVFFINWLEKEGTSVSNVLDLGSMKMFAFVTHDGGDGPGPTELLRGRFARRARRVKVPPV
jgi:hypothetical protein